jgi:hypothetical protein
MVKGDSNQPLVWALVAALMASLLLVVFLLGREAGRARPLETGEASSPDGPQGAESLLFQPDRAGKAAAEATAAPRPTAPVAQRRQLAFATESDEERIELGPEGRFVLSNTRRRPSRPSSLASPGGTVTRTAGVAASVPTPGAAASAASYFEQMGAIQSSHATANPEAFATALVEASVRGDSSGFDVLLEDSARMQAQARQIQAPPGCEAHQKATLQLLEESHAMLQQLRGAVTGDNLQDLTFMNAKVESLQAKALALQEMEAQILSRY